MTVDEAAALYTANLELIDEIARARCRRSRLAPDKTDDFVQTMHLALIKDDYAALRKFQGRAKLKTYLTTIVNHRFLDGRTAEWGRWRASAIAKRLGEAAELLESLLYRDGRSLDEAIEILESNHGVTESRSELRRYATLFPARQGRWFVDDDQLEERPAIERAEDRVRAMERAKTRSAVYDALSRAMQGLSDEEWLFVRFKYFDGISVAQISRTLGVEQRGLYTLHDRIRKQLADAVRSRGIGPHDVRDVLGWDADPAENDREDPTEES